MKEVANRVFVSLVFHSSLEMVRIRSVAALMRMRCATTSAREYLHRNAKRNPETKTGDE